MKTYKRVYIYRELEKMPTDGWLQSCFICYCITSLIQTYKIIEKKKYIMEFNVYICPHCNVKIKNDEKVKKKYENRCDLYIDENFILP